MEENVLITLKKKRKWPEILLYVVILILILLIIFLNLVSLCGVLGTSMENTLEDKQNVLLLNGKGAGRGDVVAIKNGQGKNDNIIKRIVAVAGDKIVFATGDEVTVDIYFLRDGEFSLLEEAYIKDKMDYVINGRRKYFLQGVWSVYFYKDGFNPEKAEQYVIEVPDNSFFALGDNRNNSNDSREYGFFDRSNLLGRMILKMEKGSFLERVFLFLYRKDN